MVAKAPAKTPPRQRSKFSAIFDALVATPPVKTQPLPEMRRTFVNQNPEEELMRMEQMMNMRSPMKAPPAMAAPSAMRMHSGTPNVPSRQAVPFDPSLPFDPSMPIGVASMPGRRPAPAPTPAAPRPPEKRMDTLLRGIGSFLGYIPQGGTRGDRTEMIADLARGLLGEKPIREEEAELNQRMAGEMLRRALATGDVDEIARLDPDMAMKLQEFGTFDEDQEFTRQDRANTLTAAATQEQVSRAELDQDAEENRLLSATRTARGLYEASGGDPEVFKDMFAKTIAEQGNLFSSTEAELGMVSPEGLMKYFQPVAIGSTGSVQKMQVANIPGIGPVYVDANREPVMYNGEYVRPPENYRLTDTDVGVPALLNTNTGDFRFAIPSVPGAPAGAAPGATSAPGVAPIPGTPGGSMGSPASSGQVDPYAGLYDYQKAALNYTNQQALQESLGSARGAAIIKIDESLAAMNATAPIVVSQIQELEAMTDEDLGLISGLPTVDKAKFGGLGFVDITAPGSRAATVYSRYNGLMQMVRKIAFDGLKGAGQVTEAESAFAATAAANLKDGKYANPEEMRKEMDQVRRYILLSILTQRARQQAYLDGDMFLAYNTTDEAIEQLREKYVSAEVAQLQGPSPLAPRSSQVKTTKESLPTYTFEEAQKLPTGTIFIDPDGVQRTKN